MVTKYNIKKDLFICKEEKFIIYIMAIKINKKLLWMKGHYFLFNAGTAPVVPFMPVLAKQLGYSSVVVGTIYMILPIVGMLTKPLTGFISDRYQRHRALFIGAQILTAIAFFLMLFIPSVPKQSPQMELHCHNGITKLRYCSFDWNSAHIEKLKEHYDKELLVCKLICQNQPYMRDIIEIYWFKSNHSFIAENNIEISTTLDMSNIISETYSDNKECIFIHILHSKAQLNGSNITMYCPKNKPYFNATCQVKCQNDDYLQNELTENRVIHTGEAAHLFQFWLFFGLLILSWASMAAVVSIGDGICFGLLDDKTNLYGKQRVFGAIGWGMFSIITGVLVDSLSEGSKKDYTIAFWITAILLGLDVAVSSKIKYTQTHLSSNILKDIGQMFLSLRCVVFFIWCILIGFGTALIWNFLFWHLETLSTSQDNMKTLQGFVMAIQCFCGELPFFFFSGWILKKIGHINAMSLILFAFGVRFLLYSMLQDVWYVLPIELLNGVTFGLFYATMASYASIVAPPGTESTMQGLVGAIFEGVGVSMGSIIGGALFSSVGGSHTFEIFGIAAFIAFVLHVLIQILIQKQHQTIDSTENGTVKYLAPSDAMHKLNESDFVL